MRGGKRRVRRRRGERRVAVGGIRRADCRWVGLGGALELGVGGINCKV